MDYRGPVGVVLYNLGENSYTVKEGERVAQLVVEKIFMPKIEEVKVCHSVKTITTRINYALDFVPPFKRIMNNMQIEHSQFTL